jgi:hypothetical protein
MKAINITLHDKVELRVSLLSHGSPEQFEMHIKQALKAIK